MFNLVSLSKRWFFFQKIEKIELCLHDFPEKKGEDIVVTLTGCIPQGDPSVLRAQKAQD